MNVRQTLLSLLGIALSVIVVHGTLTYVLPRSSPSIAVVIVGVVLANALAFSVLTGWLAGVGILIYGFVAAPESIVPLVAMVVVALLSFGALRKGLFYVQTRRDDERGWTVDDGGMDFGGG